MRFFKQTAKFIRKTSVTLFCLAKNVSVKIVKNCSISELSPILKKYYDLESSAIKGLVDYEAKARYGVKHCKDEFLVTLQEANGRNHINAIESF